MFKRAFYEHSIVATILDFQTAESCGEKGISINRG